MEHEPIEINDVIQEVAGLPHELTEGQVARLQLLDQQILTWCDEIDKAVERQNNYKEYVSRTHDYKNYDRP